MILMDEIFNYIKEDLPYGDLSVNLQENPKIKTKLEIYTREDILVSGSEISSKIGEILGLKSTVLVESKNFAKVGDKIVEFQGNYDDIHKTWKLSQVFLEYSSGISTYTYKMKKIAQSINPKCQILGTRKTFPFAKKVCLKALNDGGGFIHRLNLSDSILFFDKHRIIYKDDNEFYSKISKFKDLSDERKIVVETLNLNDAYKLMECGTEVILLDKFSKQDVEKVLKFRDNYYKNVKIICAGGINLTNILDYASADAIVTSAMYQAKMVDLGANIYKI